MRLSPLTPNLFQAAAALNARLDGACLDSAFRVHIPDGQHRVGMRPEQWVMADGESVHGSVLLQQQRSRLRDQDVLTVNLQTPISEGRVDGRFTHVAGSMLTQLCRKYPLVTAVGMGDRSLPLPRLLKALNWTIVEVPFWFRVLRAKPFLQNIAPLRTTKVRRLIADAAAISGAGTVAVSVDKALRPRTRELEAKPISQWGPWADQIWEKSCALYSFTTRRRGEDLGAFLPVGLDGLQAWKFEFAGKPVGWAAGYVRSGRNPKYFGNMKLGSIIDCLAVPGFEQDVIAAATEAMRARGADLLVSNQLHPVWKQAFAACRFRTGPSNYLLGLSPKLAAQLDLATAHITRADGDGRVNL